MRITVAGAGAVGCVVATALAEAGHETSVLARGETLAAIREHGVGIEDQGGRRRVHVNVDSEPSFGVQDVIFACVKAHDLPVVAERLQMLIDEHTIIVPMSNGVPFWLFHGQPDGDSNATIPAVDPQGNLGHLLPLSQIIGAVVYVTAGTVAPGVSSPRGSPHVLLGEPMGGMSDRLTRLQRDLQPRGVEIRAVDQIRSPLWTKLILNVSTNFLSVLTGTTLGEMCGDAGLQGLIRQVIAETTMLAESFGVVPDIQADRLIQMGRSLGPAKTSTLQDYERGRRLEIGAIGDAVLELGELRGLALPATRALVSITSFLGERRQTMAPTAP